MSDEREERKVWEVEVERLPSDQDREAFAARGAPRAPASIGPVLAGVILDGIDLLTPGPLGLRFGFLIGGIAGYTLARRLGVSGRAALVLALVAGAYCSVPNTERLPVATLIGLYARFVGRA